MQKEAARDIIIVDTTLRDGEQMPGVAFNVEEKIAIAKLLDKIGVHIIEVGIPVMGGEEKIAVQKIIQAGLKAQVTTWNRIVLSDLRASIQCGARYLHLSAPVSDLLIEKKLGKTRQWVLRCLQGAIRYAADYGCTISVGAEDASRAEFNFLAEYAQLAAEYGAVRLRYADTVGIMEPFSVYRLIKNLIDIVDIDIEIHTHNDFGLSTANSLAAIIAGAKAVSTTVNGIGERAGNASLDQVCLALRYIFKHPINLRCELLPEISRMVNRFVGFSK